MRCRAGGYASGMTFAEIGLEGLLEVLVVIVIVIVVLSVVGRRV